MDALRSFYLPDLCQISFGILVTLFFQTQLPLATKARMFGDAGLELCPGTTLNRLWHLGEESVSLNFNFLCSVACR